MFVERPVGIDLGTTNSEIALLLPSEKDILIYADRFGRKIIPSAVAWDPATEKILVGHAARAKRGKDPAPIESIKRKMGQNTRLLLGREELLPEEISAKILGELRDRMAEHLATQARDGVEMVVRRVVITVPAYFDAPQVEATRRAGEIAGLDVIGILHEPTAAAIYHTWRSKLGDGNFLVYDLGGGTFDVSILRCLGGEYQVLAIDGDNYLGGDDLDRRFAEWLRAELARRGYALDLDVRGDATDRARFARLVHLAQEIKESLSTAKVVNVSKQAVLTDKKGVDVSFEAEIGLAEYEKVVGDLVETTIKCAERAIARAKEVADVGIEQIDHVVLVGGSTRVPLVARRVTDAFCKPSRSQTPLADEVDTCVALGAAVHAAQIGGLRIGDADAGATVSFNSPLVGHKATLRVDLRVEAAPDGAREVSVRHGGNDIARASFDVGTNVKLEVPLGEHEENAMELALTGDRGALATLPFALYRGDVRPRATDLSRPSVVSKDIALEVVRGGKRERKIVLARGTGLPANAKHRFFTGDQSGSVVLRLLQNRLPIKALVLEVPPNTAVGTPVDLTLKCDEAMRLEALASVAGRELWAQVDAPEPMKLSQSVDALLEEAESASRGMWGAFGNVYKREAEQLSTSIREVIATDPDKLEALCQRLRLLIDEFRGAPGDELSPPMHQLEGTMHSLRLIVYRSATPVLGMDRAAWDARIAGIEERANAAYSASDAAGWRRVCNEAQALLETAHQEEFATMRVDDPAYLGRRLASSRSWAQRVERAVSDFVPAAAEEVRAMQAKEQTRLHAWLHDRVHRVLAPLEVVEATDAAQMRRTLDEVNAELERIETALERIPQVGLVTDRGS